MGVGSIEGDRLPMALGEDRPETLQPLQPTPVVALGQGLLIKPVPRPEDRGFAVHGPVLSVAQAYHRQGSSVGFGGRSPNPNRRARAWRSKV